MKTEELLMYNLKHDLPLVNTYDNRYAEVGLRQLVENSEHDACMYYELAARYRQGIGGAPKSSEKAYEYYQKVLLSQRNVRAMYWLGELCLFNLPGREQESLLCLKTADSLGDRDAAFLLGYIALERDDIAPVDAAKAYALFKQAEERGRINLIDQYLGRCAEKLEMYDEARKYYTNGLNRGDKTCANYLGYMYYVGDQVEPNLEYAKKFFRIGLEAKDASGVNYAKMMLAHIDLNNGTPKEKYDAFVYLKNNVTSEAINLSMGKAFFEGIPGYLEKDHDEAMKYFKAASDSDRGEAFFCMSWIYYGREDNKNGDRYLLSAAHHGYGPACYVAMESDRLTLMHVRESMDELVKTYDDKYDKASIHAVKNAAATDPAAMYELGSRYRIGQDGAEKDSAEAMKWYRKVLWYQRNVRAMHFIALHLYQEKDDVDLAQEYWELAYSYGDVDAAVNLGLYYEHGTDKVKIDLDKALKLYMFAKEHGRKDADSFIGVIYQKKGQFDLAEKLFHSALAADRENSFAYCDLGFFYIDQKNPKYNEDEAIKWFEEAAKRGNEEAQRVLKTIEENRKAAAERKAAEEAKKKAKRVPTAEQILKKIQELEKNYAETLGERYSILSHAEKQYPNHPEILRSYISVFNIRNYLLKNSNDAAKYQKDVYNGFHKVLELIERLAKISGMNPGLKQEKSFALTHLADLAMVMNRDQYAWSLLEQADHFVTPWASVVAMQYLFRRCDEIQSNAQLSDREKKKRKGGYHQLAKKEVDALAKTVEQASLWNSQKRERALGYFTLHMCYQTREFEPYIRYNATLAKKYLDKCAQLNPDLPRELRG